MHRKKAWKKKLGRRFFTELSDFVVPVTEDNLVAFPEAPLHGAGAFEKDRKDEK
jgi:hypothetical protein